VYAPSTDGAWRHVRAVPCTAGSAVIFSHRTIHWGSQGRPGSSHGPRVSISFAGSDHSFAVASDVVLIVLMVLIVASIRPQVFFLASSAFAGLCRCIPLGWRACAIALEAGATLHECPVVLRARGSMGGVGQLAASVHVFDAHDGQLRACHRAVRRPRRTFRRRSSRCRRSGCGWRWLLLRCCATAGTTASP
jgi:hypothetical protein